MGRKSRKAAPEKPRDAAEYYRLNTKAVDDLVTADRSNSPQVSEAELRKLDAQAFRWLMEGLEIAPKKVIRKCRQKDMF